MGESLLYDLLEKAIIGDWREETKEDEITCFTEREKEEREALLRELPKKYKDILSSYTIAVEERMDYLHYNLHIKLLNLGVRLGMELQKVFNNQAE